MILFILVNIVFLPILGGIFGNQETGFVSPVGMSVLIGAFVFGIGMQLEDGYVSGSVIGSAHFTWWMITPNIGPVSFIETFGVPGDSSFSLHSKCYDWKHNRHKTSPCMWTIEEIIEHLSLLLKR